ncbi:UDP-N-acetylglucosamine transporter UGNT1 isoform X1 [Lathyrus oleraceus]|uniref:UDP-N-acetylglucosamine transporter UGNT1 isoform X1 n=1 Tax=Pisum sativum TaxID=3888 RepID=UPI0021CDFC4E|nr:UDP-N-acetylglucosamine transporter UGNT1-like isoform X1 [Pisum sativum]
MESTKNLLPLSNDMKESKETEEHKVPTMTRKGVYTALSYMTSSVLLVMFNKAALTCYNFPFANVITLSQMVCAFVILYVLKSFNIISLTTESQNSSKSKNSILFVPFTTLVHTFPLAITYLLFMVVTMEAVRGINIPMYTTLRRTTVAFTMIMEYFLSGKKHSIFVLGSVGIIIAGALVAGARDLSFDAYAYSVVFIENMCKAVYLASISRVGKASGLNIFGLVWSNVLICGPMLFFWSLLRGDLQSTLNFTYLLYPGFQVVMILSCAFTFFINYIVVLNTTVNSALTQAICGNLKDVFTSGFGWIIFGGLPYDLVNTNKSLWELKIFIGDLFTLFTSFHVKLLIMYYVLLSCSSMFLVNHLASLGPVCMPIVRYKENEDKFHFEIRHRIWISLPSFSYIVYKKDKF